MDIKLKEQRTVSQPSLKAPATHGRKFGMGKHGDVLMLLQIQNRKIKKNLTETIKSQKKNLQKKHRMVALINHRRREKKVVRKEINKSKVRNRANSSASNSRLNLEIL